jgi:hypothetical protein
MHDGKGQIIAIVGAFDYPNAAADLMTFKTFKLKTMYGLPGRAPCTVAAGPHPCFQVLANELRTAGNLSSNNVLNSPIYDAARRDCRDNFFDIKSRSNGACGGVCMAAKGYDFVTGLGSPKADELVEELAHN